MCPGKIVFFLPKVVFLFVCFCFFPASLFQPLSLNLLIFSLPLSASSGTHYLVILYARQYPHTSDALSVFLQFLFLPLKCYKILCLIMPSFSKIKMRTQSGKCKWSCRTWVVASSGSRGPGGVGVQEIYLGHNSKDKGEERGQEQVGRAFS